MPGARSRGVCLCTRVRKRSAVLNVMEFLSKFLIDLVFSGNPPNPGVLLCGVFAMGLVWIATRPEEGKRLPPQKPR